MMLCNVSLPAHKHHSHTIILLHGHDSSARLLSDQIFGGHDRLGDSLQHIFPSVKWVFPQAEEIEICRDHRHYRRWHDIWDTRTPSERRDLQIPGLKETTIKLVDLIQGEALTVGLQNVVLGGIEQGCATAIQALLNYPKPVELEPVNGENGESMNGKSANGEMRAKRLFAFIGLSGWMSLGMDSVHETRALLNLNSYNASDIIFRNTPAFISHCINDTKVPIVEGEKLRNTLMTYGMSVTWRQYHNGGNWLNASQGIDDLAEFLENLGLKRRVVEERESHI